MSRVFRAPKGNGELLVVPTFADVGELARRNRELLDAAEVVIDGTRLREFREATRQEVGNLVLGEEVVLPPTRSSPSARIDPTHGGGGVEWLAPWHLHSSQPANTSPLVGEVGAANDVRQAGWGGVPFTNLWFVTGHQPELFHPGVWAKNFTVNGLARRFNAIPLNLIVDNDTMKSAHVLAPVWDADPAKVRIEKQPCGEFHGGRPWEQTPWSAEFSARRIATERRWGCQNVELLVSTLSQSTACRRFAAHITANLTRFRTAYNRAVAEYRTAHGIRSKSHPVPDLALGELPFWEFTDTGRVRATPATPPERLRPRALTLTLFVRLCLADWFIHGIGGAKYDEVTDALIRDFFGIEPPTFQVVTGTLHLPSRLFPSTPDDVAALKLKVRQLRWNPEYFLPNDHPARVEKLQLTAEKPNGRPAVRRWFARIREVTGQMRTAVAEVVAETERQLASARAEVAANAVLQRRDYPWVLYPEDVLRPFLQQFL